MPDGPPELTIDGRTFVLLPKEDYGRLAPLLVGAELGRALRERRRSAGLTQAELAARAGIRLETLSRIENGRGNPTVGTLRALHDGLEGRPRA
jgi:DNA-binding XRE family transcriptional regulator